MAHSADASGRKSFFTPGRILILLVLAALIIRVAAALTRQMVQLDETGYLSMARSLANGQGLLDISHTSETHFSPLLPMIVAAIAVVARSYIFAGYAVVTLFGSLLLIPTYLLGAEFAGKRIGLMAAALVAVTPLFVDYSSRVYTESVYIFFLLFAILFGYRMIRDRQLLPAALAGVALGLAYLADPEALYYLVVLVALAILVELWRWQGRRNGKSGEAPVSGEAGGWGRAVRATAFFLAVFLVFAAPYVIFLHSQLGRWTYNGKMNAGNIYDSTHNLGANTPAWDMDLLSLTNNNSQLKVQTLPDTDLLAFMAKNPVTALKNFVKQSYDFYGQEMPKVIPLWLLPLLGLGLFGAGWTRRRAIQVGYLVLMMAPIIVILAMYAHDRFFMPFVPLVMIWIAQGWEALQGWAGKTVSLIFQQPWRERLRAWIPWLIGIVILGPMLAYSATDVLKQSYPVGYKQAGEYIQSSAGDGKRVMSREYSAAYYADGTAVLLPYADYDRTTEYARKQGIDFLVINTQELATWRPTLARLSESQSQHPEWKLINRIQPGTSRETLIFQLQPRP